MSRETLLNYRVSGKGHPVIFLHGFLESNTMWDQLLPHLPNVKAYCVELFGHGDSPSFDGQLTIEKLAHEVLAIIKEESLTSYSIIGHSLGGYVALALFNINPLPSCEQLILLNSHPWEDSLIKKEERTQVANIIKKNKSLFIKQSIPKLFQNPMIYQQAVENLINEALEIKASDIATTTLAMRDRSSSEAIIAKNNYRTVVIQGEHDRLIPTAKMKLFCKHYKIPFINIKNAGHMIHVEQKKELIKKLNTLL